MIGTATDVLRQKWCPNRLERLNLCGFNRCQTRRTPSAKLSCLLISGYFWSMTGVQRPIFRIYHPSFFRIREIREQPHPARKSSFQSPVTNHQSRNLLRPHKNVTTSCYDLEEGTHRNHPPILSFSSSCSFLSSVLSPLTL